jgi:hypothetical protein
MLAVQEVGQVSDQAAQEGRTQFWFNLKTGKVQTNYDKGQGKNLMGPYPTAEQARNALSTARERTKAWDEQDRRWRAGDDAD